jgi:putative aldouronate transport system substrate-binding protein
MSMGKFNRTRRGWVLAIVMTLILPLLAACGGNNDGNTGGDSSEPATNTAAGKNTDDNAAAEGVDLSKKVNLKMYLLGDVPQDKDIWVAELNKLIEKDLNATLSIEYLPWSDWQQKYPLILASGENVDLIYTSDWALYTQEAAKGAFIEVTDEMLTKYMPLTSAQQDKVSLDQGRINGKLFFVPRSTAAYTGEGALLIRGDLREKYGLPELKSIDDLEKYYTEIAKNEKGIFPYAASISNGAKGILYNTSNNLVDVFVTTVGVGSFAYPYSKDGTFSIDSVDYSFFMPQYVDFAKRMKKWADLGFWSKNAPVNKTEPRDALESGTGASLAWNIGTLATSADKIAKEHSDWKPEIYDINPNSIKQMGLYTNDGMAVAYTSKNVERSFMLLDKLKFDRTYQELFANGITGKHWIPVGDTEYKPGPDFEKFKPGANGTWGVDNKDFQRKMIGENPVLKKTEDAWTPLTVHPITEGFKFDPTSVKSELATFTSLETKYGSLLDLGLVKDVDATMAEFKDKAKKAGYDKILAELKKQLDAFVKAKQ